MQLRFFANYGRLVCSLWMTALTSASAETSQCGLGRSPALHLLSGALTTLIYVVLAPLVIRAGFPPLFALLIATLGGFVSPSRKAIHKFLVNEAGSEQTVCRQRITKRKGTRNGADFS